MDAWTALENRAYSEVWSHFDNAFGFRPSVHAKDWPSINTHLPQFKFSLEGLWNGPQDNAVYDDLAQKILNAFIGITAPGEQVYALDWQHDSYLVDLRKQGNTKGMKVSFFPDGDYSIFITRDFKNMWFGHPWENKITVAGEPLIKAFKDQRPLFLDR